MRNFLLCVVSFALLLNQGCKKNTSAVAVSSSTVAKYSLNKEAGPKGKVLSVGPNVTFGTYEIMSVTSGQTAEIADLSLANGGNVDLSAYNEAAHQQWRVINVTDGYFKIMNLGSGKFLQAVKVDNGYQLQQQSDDSNDDQIWQISSTGENSYRAINKACGLSPTVDQTTGLITLETYAEKSSQMWSVIKIPDMAYRDDAVVNFFHRTSGSVAFDQGNSIPLADGRTLWVAEDTYSDRLLNQVGLFNCNQIFDIHNSMLLQPANHSWDNKLTNNLITTASPYKYEVVPSPGEHNSSYSWPGVGVELNGHVYMYCFEATVGGSSTTALYDFTETAGNNWPNPVRTTPAGMNGPITYTEGMMRPGDGYVYTYGSIGVFVVKYLFVARFAETDPQTWTFWNGKSWQSTPTTATEAKITTATTDYVMANTAISYVNGKYVMMQMDIGYFCNPSQHNIYVSTSNTPFGPFTAPKKVFTIEDRINGYVAKYYTPAIHPQFNNGLGELLLTYCLNYNGSGSPCSTNVCTNNGYMDPNFYQVKGVRVPYSLIGL
ncbi:RICIN domain-containing protein [Mucilaginibacter sp. 21P]|uniref:RICIN domain-containing protein n=1 Tax=Mucilaginibacter sp. 21P TaxID=2778902 RepID=UPI001C56D99D|nr:RICIN domain-containing protein [Mucilaginibacter sp. 21P]QXV65255.1 RICIN domain-containing protein [Mucilaginibacter sp. 21P]